MRPYSSLPHAHTVHPPVQCNITAILPYGITASHTNAHMQLSLLFYTLSGRAAAAAAAAWHCADQICSPKAPMGEQHAVEVLSQTLDDVHWGLAAKSLVRMEVPI